MNIKTFVVPAVSCAIGFGIGCVFMKKVIVKLAPKIVDNVFKEIDDEKKTRKEFEKKKMALEERKRSIFADIDAADAVKQIQEENGYSAPDEPADDNEVTIDEYENNSWAGQARKATEKYLAEHETPNEDEDDNDINEIVPPIHPEDYIFVIDVDEYENEYEYDHVEITYYEEDQVFCDESEKRIEDPEQIFGKNVDDLFGRNPINPDDVIFIRNTWFENVYQITRIHNSYGRVVLGLDD